MKTNFIPYQTVSESSPRRISIIRRNPTGRLSFSTGLHLVGNTSRGNAPAVIKPQKLTLSTSVRIRGAVHFIQQLTVSPLRALVTMIPILSVACATDETTDRRWILGLGWVDSVNNQAVNASSVTAIGFLAGPEGIQTGLIQTHSTTIDPSLAGNALVKVESSPLKLTVATRAIESPTDHP
jgi:hypothetical protein